MEILYDFPIQAPASRVFRAVSSPAGLDSWWTLDAYGTPVPGNVYELGFGPEYRWRALVRKAVPGVSFELEMTTSDADWRGTRISWELTEQDSGTRLRFQHSGWLEANEHYRVSAFCWAMYLRLLKRYCETGDVVAYQERLDA